MHGPNWLLKRITDLGSLIGNLDFGYFTVWIFSNFPATLILREINFASFQKVKKGLFTVFDWILSFLKSFILENVISSRKFKIHCWSNGEKWKYQFLRLQKDQTWFHVKSEWRKILNFRNCVSPIRLPRPVE